jgi:phospholipid/cholesterol/gamma-HCH transport system substrate-binding protein
MRQTSTEIKVGVAVVAAVLILILGVMWIEKMSFSDKFARYTVYFDDVGGLDPGDPITVSGVSSGEVGAVILEPGRVKTELLINETVTLFDDCKVQIFTMGLMGEKYIGIAPGSSGTPLPHGSTIQGEYKTGMAEAVAGFGDVVEEFNETVRAFRTLIETEGRGASLGDAIQKIDELSTEILGILRENRADFRSTAKNMERLTGDMGDVVGSSREKLTRGIDDFATAAARLDSVTVSLREITRSIENRDGTLGMLISDKKLHEDMEQVLENLNSLLDDVKADPQRYLKIEIF